MKAKFHLAVSYNNFLTASQNPPDNSPRQFMQETPVRYSIDQFIRHKPYEVVGIKELRPFRSRLRKLEKMNTKWAGFGRSTRRISEVVSEEKDDLLSKGEVIQCLSHAIKSQVITDTVRQGQANSMNSIVLRGENELRDGPIETAIYRNPSVSQIKARMRTFQAQWAKKALQILAEPPRSQDKQVKKRKEKEQKEKEENGSGNSELWQLTLRNSTSLADLAKKKRAMVVIRDERCIKTRGHSKFKSETQWLELKCQEGYRFKLSCQPTKRML